VSESQGARGGGAAPAPEALLLINAEQIVTCAGPARGRRGMEMRDAAIRAGHAVAFTGERVAMVDEQARVERAYPSARRIDCRGHIVTPGLVDSHTHAIFGRPRYAEQEMRAAGVGYMEIARQGGGIHSSVRDLRARSETELVELARTRLQRLASYGTTTVEVKSGYGLSLDDEMKMLRVIASLSSELPMRLVPTFLGAHEIPLEYRGSPADRATYVKIVLENMLPEVATSRLARFTDVFCEPGAFTIEESRAILTRSRDLGLRLKLHADELEPSGGAELAAELAATSADHLGAISSRGIEALAATDTVATILPGTMLFLGETSHAPARALVDSGAIVALASDFNPGTSPTVNFPLILTLGVSQLHLSASEAFLAATVNGAAALAIADHVGQLAPDFSADIAIWEAEDLRELPYWYGDRRCRGTWTRGKACHPCELPVY
jgi:imidazolonepropionase